MLGERREAIKGEMETRKRLAEKIAKGETGTQVRSFEKMEGEKMDNEKRYDRTSPEYRTAWLKNIAVRNDGTKVFSPTELMHIDWLCENVVGKIPPFEDILPPFRKARR